MAKESLFDAAEYLDSPEAVADYLSEAFESGDDKLIARALGAVARAKGMTEVANDPGLSRESLYRSLSEQGRPRTGDRDEGSRFPRYAIVRATEGEVGGLRSLYWPAPT